MVDIGKICGLSIKFGVGLGLNVSRVCDSGACGWSQSRGWTRVFLISRDDG